MAIFIMKAWLITWEWIGDHAAMPEKVVAILSPHWSDEKVREYVEVLYSNLTYSFSERMSYAKRKKDNPYPAKFDMYGGRIHCGHNPSLYARKVENLRVSSNEDGSESLSWDEIPIPERVLEHYRKKREEQA
ncbi:hypothetical protein A3C37_01770 [Candidatus Peribacteria bacterium RIFCSPHIGHO2_02_FULL_53_20]|nr:MAG: hypothetical protein A3C37_01770 [Candidatus Peribacteria bacterium RIFCSPHIGHO2_02_FULL_53_20]